MTNIERLQNQINKISIFPNKDIFCPEFKVWRKNTIRTIISIFGEKSQEYGDFDSINYNLGVIYNDTTDEEEKIQYLEGLDESKFLLESLIDDLTIGAESRVSMDDFWSLFKDELIEVSQELFNDTHYSNSVFEGTKLLNNKVRKIVKTSTGNEFDGADLMNRAFSLTNPIITLGDLDNETGKNIQKGYMDIYRGTMVAIRNPKGHETITITKEKAIHFLFLINLLLIKLDEEI